MLPPQLLNPYELLGVTIESSPADVRKAFYELAKIMHPDKGGTASDMDALYNAYCYVHQQLLSVNREATIEQLQVEFDNFCKMQTDGPPPFVDIHNDWAQEFNNAWEKKPDSCWNSSEQVGYGDVMVPSEYQEKGLVEPVPFKDIEVKPVQHSFGQQLIQYAEPLAFGCFGDNTFTQQTHNGIMSDYREAFMDAPSNLHEKVSETQLTDEALQSFLYDRKLLQDSLEQELPQGVNLAYPPQSQHATAYILG